MQLKMEDALRLHQTRIVASQVFIPKNLPFALKRKEISLLLLTKLYLHCSAHLKAHFASGNENKGTEE